MSEKITASFEDGVASISYAVDGRKKSRTIPAEAFCKALLAGTNAGKSVTFNPPGLRVHARSGDKVIVGYEFPERVAKMPFRGPTSDKPIELDSVWPWGLTLIEFSDTPTGLQLTRFYQFGLKGPITGMDQMLYVWPGSNVYDGHNCCIGSINVPKLQGIEQTGGLPYIFYNGISNNDLSDHRFTAFTVPDGNKRITKPIELYRHLAVQDGKPPMPFPYNIMKNAKSLASFLSEMGYK